MTTNLVDILVQEVEALLRDLAGEPGARWLFDGRASREEYAAFLVQTYHYVLWTRPLLSRAAARLAASGGAPELASLFAEKADEESGHEQWVLADLAALGYDPHAAKRSPRGPAAEAYVAWNRLCVEVGAPEAFLGTAFVLEALATHCAARAAENLIAHSGIPSIAGAVRFLRGHAAADHGHVAHLAALLAAVKSPRARDAIALSARITCAIYPLLLATAPVGAALNAPEASEARRGATRQACQTPAEGAS